MYWTEYTSRRHLLTQMSQPVSPGISLVYATDIAFWRQSQCMGKQSCWQKPKDCKRLQAALTCLTHTHFCYTFKTGLAKLELFAKVSVLPNSLTLKYFRYQALSNILKPSKTHSMQLTSWGKSPPIPSSPKLSLRNLFFLQSIRLNTHYLQFLQSVQCQNWHMILPNGTQFIPKLAIIFQQWKKWLKCPS